jgi:hypothetical protein
MYTNNRDAYRQAFFTVWQKYQKKLPLDVVEQQLIEVILLHPEYHKLLVQSDLQNQEFALEENPFFHLSLHIAIREQIRMDRPAGIKSIYQQLLIRYPDEAEHRMMECLAQIMWQAQQTGEAPSEAVFLERLKDLR